MKNYNSDIGAWLAEQRQKKGLSQQDVADKLGMTRTAVHYWESGKRVISAENMIDYCLAINADPAECVAAIMKK